MADVVISLSHKEQVTGGRFASVARPHLVTGADVFFSQGDQRILVVQTDASQAGSYAQFAEGLPGATFLEASVERDGITQRVTADKDHVARVSVVPKP